MKLGRRGVGVGEGLGFIASFPLCPPFPIEADAVVTRLALAFTVITFWSFFSALDLPILAGPVMVMFSERLISSRLLCTPTNSHCDYASWARHFLVFLVEACQCEVSKTGS